MALTADAWQRGGKAATLITDAFVTQIVHRAARAGTTVARGVTWRDNATGADAHARRRKVVVLAGGLRREPAAVAELRAAEPERLGRARAAPTTTSTGSSA